MYIKLEEIEQFRPLTLLNTIDLWDIGELQKKLKVKYKAFRDGDITLIMDDVLPYLQLHRDTKFRPKYFSKARIPKWVWEQIPRRSGLYFLYQIYEIVYIGMSEENIFNRVHTHCRKLPFDALTWITIEEITQKIPHVLHHDLYELERKLIKKYNPKYNVQCRT